jgi:hypothetical protein
MLHHRARRRPEGGRRYVPGASQELIKIAAPAIQPRFLSVQATVIFTSSFAA